MQTPSMDELISVYDAWLPAVKQFFQLTAKGHADFACGFMNGLPSDEAVVRMQGA
ncbi:hypothetical protein AGMMS49992_32270 [Clostridia bacterium]|nr:hypothetical protein AGMMS49992_32270 [Clostridia bacterium]